MTETNTPRDDSDDREVEKVTIRVSAEEYAKAQERRHDVMRKNITIGVLVMFGVMLLAYPSAAVVIAVSAPEQWDTVSPTVSMVFNAVVGLTNLVVGYYFGQRSKSAD